MRRVLFAIALTLASASAVPADEPETLRIAVVGQALIKSDLREVAPLAVAQAREYLAGADVVFTNLEVAVTSRGIELTPRSERVTPAPPEVVDTLKEMGFNMLALSNNHALDLGVYGLFTTIAEVSQRGFAHAGTGANEQAAAAAGYLDTPNGRVALIGIASGAVQLEDPETWAGPTRPGVNYLDVRADGTLDPEQRARIFHAVRTAASQADVVIVYHHNHLWGERRGLDTPPDRDPRIDRFDTPAWQETLARELIDAGAGMFVGHGNPALHGIEIYQGRPILYGLGNFIFELAGTLDRYGPTAFQSVVAHVELRNGRVTGMRFRPLVLALNTHDGGFRGTPYLAQTGEAHGILLWLADRSARYGTRIRIEGESGYLELP